jgi:hypothetical protein
MVIRVLLDAKADVDAKNCEKRPLHWATGSWHEAVVRILLGIRRISM